LARQGLDQLSDQPMTLGMLQPHRAPHDNWLELESLADATAQTLRVLRLDRNDVAADLRSQRVGRVHRHQFPVVQNREPIAAIRLFHQVRGH
jgi:hypothetical protein